MPKAKDSMIFSLKNKNNLAFIISRLFGPVTFIIFLWLTTALKSGLGFWKAIWVYPVIFVFSIGIPLIITTYLVAIKRVSDIDWSNIEARNKYLLPLSVPTLSIFIFLFYFLTNSTLFHLSLVLAAIMIAGIFITSILKFKISGHMILASMTIANFNLFFHMGYLWLYFLLIPIAWARYTLKVHTIKELVAGIILANGIMLLALLIFGWPNIPK